MNQIQHFYLADMAKNIEYSWTFAPVGLRRMFRPMMDNGWCTLQTRTFDDDPQAYQFVVISKKGRKALNKGASS